MDEGKLHKDFNSTKVQFRVSLLPPLWILYSISIPLRYNLELIVSLTRVALKNFNSTKVQFRA